MTRSQTAKVEIAELKRKQTPVLTRAQTAKMEIAELKTKLHESQCEIATLKANALAVSVKFEELKEDATISEIRLGYMCLYMPEDTCYYCDNTEGFGEEGHSPDECPLCPYDFNGRLKPLEEREKAELDRQYARDANEDDEN